MNADELHRLAMDWADKGFLSEFRGDENAAQGHFKKALSYEKEAAILAVAARSGQPSTGILLRSAATLAYFCHEYQTARELAEMSAAAAAPFEIRYELGELLFDLKDRFIKIANTKKAAWRKGEDLNKQIDICGIPIPSYPAARISLGEKFLEWAPVKAAELAESLCASVLFSPADAIASGGPAEIFNRIHSTLRLNP